jgi:hypothetical protein
MSYSVRRSPQRPISPSSFMERPSRPKTLYEYRKCKICGDPAKQECYGCRNTYYCTAECHKNDWYEHRANCKLMVSSGHRSK